MKKKLKSILAIVFVLSILASLTLVPVIACSDGDDYWHHDCTGESTDTDDHSGCDHHDDDHSGCDPDWECDWEWDWQWSWDHSGCNPDSSSSDHDSSSSSDHDSSSSSDHDTSSSSDHDSSSTPSSSDTGTPVDPGTSDVADGILIISKTVVDANNNVLAADKGVFTFVITGPDNYTKTIKLVGNAKVTLDNLPTGAYKIAEQATDGYDTYVPTIYAYVFSEQAGFYPTVYFVNERTSTPEYTGGVSLTKVLNVPSGTTAVFPSEFTVILTGEDGTDYSVSLAANSTSKTVVNLPDGSYSIAEENADVAGFNWAVSYSGLTNGKIVVANGQIVDVTITNTYTVKNSTTDNTNTNPGSSSGTGTGSTDVPKTGDDSSMILWIALMAASAVGAVSAVVLNFRKNKSEK